MSHFSHAHPQLALWLAALVAFFIAALLLSHPAAGVMADEPFRIGEQIREQQANRRAEKLEQEARLRAPASEPAAKSGESDSANRCDRG